jgi:hypothetical protein
MAKKDTDNRISDEQREFARLILSGLPMYDAYVRAYMNGATPERTASNYTKKQIQNRASQMKNSKGVRTLLAKGLIEQDVKDAGVAVWDRRKATNSLMKMMNKAEEMLDVLETATTSLQQKYDEKGENFSFYKVYSFGVEMLSKVSDTLLRVSQELNKMYGLAVPEVVNQNAVTVVFGSTENLPQDNDLEGFVEVEDE